MNSIKRNTKRKGAAGWSGVYRSVFLAETDAILFFDAKTFKFEEVNLSALKLYGYGHREFTRLALPAIIADGGAEKVTGRIKSPKLRVQPFAGLHKKKDGTLFSAEMSVQKLKLGGRDLCVAIVRNISEQEERWRFALEGARDGVWDWNVKTDEAFFSKRWKEMVGYVDDDFGNTGKAWLEHLHPDDAPRVVSKVQDYFAGKIPIYSVEFRLRCKDGGWKWILARGMLVSRDADGNPSRMIGTHTDLTERKIYEEKIKSSLQEKEVLLREINHRVKNNLQVMKSLFSLQSRKVESAEVKNIFENSRARIQAIALVHQKLYQSSDLANVDAGEYIRDLIAGIFDTLRADSRRIHFSVDVDGGVCLDVDKLVQCGIIVNELVTNAVKHAFSDRREGRVVVAMRAEGEKTFLTVSDDGVGLPENMDADHSKGLGLELVKLLVGSQGKVDIVRQDGLTFKISL